MARQQVDQDWLKARLSQALGWDLGVTEGVVEAVAASTNRSEVEEIVQDFMGGNQQALDLVDTYLSAQQHAAAPPKKAAGSTPVAGARTNLRGAPVLAGQRAGGSMTVVHRAARKGKGPAQDDAPKADRSVANCLQCGKVFFPMASSGEATALVESGGACTFCTAHVALHSGDKSEERAPAAQRGAPVQQAVQRIATESPTAFKDRMVGYDRESAKRTQVLDDQSDYFDVDSNAWLSAEERKQLKAQDAAIREAEEARRNRVTVTIDLLGRQVLMEEGTSGAGLMGEQQAQHARDMATAAAATARERPHGGGTAAVAALAAADSAAGLPQTRGPMVFREMTNPTLRTPVPMFVKQPLEPPPDQGGRSSSKTSEQKRAPTSHGKPGRKAGKRDLLTRVQHDDPYDFVDLEPLSVAA
ncbi:hypothetical protein WJX73_003330 [Symbiochloris irregularis]|uniref:Activating signal cointegrator 1 third domain-containing protein n=1 Tax=Symbiochloris irregularis TaxID=706552 RepID=A0AAW1PRK1_9CHLO